MSFAELEKATKHGHQSLARCACLVRSKPTENSWNYWTVSPTGSGEDENHPLASLMDVLRALIEKYEDERVPELTE